MIFITSLTTYINDFFNEIFLLLRLPKSSQSQTTSKSSSGSTTSTTGTTTQTTTQTTGSTTSTTRSSQVGTITPTPIPQNQGTKPTVKGKPIKTYIPHNPVIKGEPVYIDSTLPYNATEINSLRKANMPTPVSQSVQQSTQQTSTLTNKNLLRSTITPKKTKGITQIIFHTKGSKSSTSTSKVGTITPTSIKEISGTSSTVKGKPIKTYIPHNPIIKQPEINPTINKVKVTSNATQTIKTFNPNRFNIKKRGLIFTRR